MRRMLPLLAVTAAALLIGCNQQKTERPATPLSGDEDISAIKTVVRTFWESVGRGDAEAAIELLSPVAQQCIRQNRYDFVPPASETMKFTLGELEIVDGDQAVIDSVWTDVDGSGNTYHEQMSLALRRVDGRWCIFGMAADMGPNEQPMVMDLESPEEFFGPQQAASSQTDTSSPRQAHEPSQPPLRR
ncbi:MAG: nuclear transport factor 2 family protein [Pirellulales bacterium]|nr:nuclear transport factor 2 family protein [Pirellulales bacterium]